MSQAKELMIEKLLNCVCECERFRVRAEATIKRLKRDKFAIYGSREMGAAKRSSMDVSNAMADLRRGPRG